MKWKEERISCHFCHSFWDRVLFKDIEAVVYFKYNGGLWASWVTLWNEVRLRPLEASLLGRWRTQEVIPLLMAFEELRIDYVSKLIGLLVRIGILQIKHLDGGRAETDLRW